MGYITLREASDYTGKSIKTIRNLIKNPDISIQRKKIKNRETIFISKNSLDTYYGNDTLPLPYQDPTNEPVSGTTRKVEAEQAEPFTERHLESLEETIELLKNQLQKKDDQLERSDQQIQSLIKSKEHSDILLRESHKQLLLIKPEQAKPKKKWFSLFSVTS